MSSWIRWDGDIRADATVETELSALVPEEVQRNMVLVHDIPANFVPWSVLTPDGKWHGGGGDADKDMDAWTVEQATILRQYPDHFAISVDFHY